MDRISIKGLRHYAYHGVLASEQDTGQLFIIDLECFLDITEAAKHDDYQATLCYQALSQLALDISIGQRFKLIESLAAAIAEAALERFSRLNRLSVTVHKSAAPLGAVVDDVAVTVRRRRASFMATQ